MKKFTFSLLVLMASMGASAKSVVFTLTDDTKVFYLLSSAANPMLRFKDGKMTEEGQLCYDNLIAAIKERKKMEFRGTSDEEMPKILDKLMFSLEKITGLDWKENSEDEIKKEIDDLIEDELKKFIKSKEAIKIMRKEARKSLKAEMKKMDDEGDSDFDEEDA